MEGREPRSLRRLDHFVRAQAPGAHPDALDAAVHDRAHRLQVGLEAPRTDVVRVTHLSSHNRALAADFTPLRHRNPSISMTKLPDYQISHFFYCFIAESQCSAAFPLTMRHISNQVVV